jgi:hypothetical protein
VSGFRTAKYGNTLAKYNLQQFCFPMATWMPEHMFADGFGSFLKSGNFSDITIVTKEREYNVHRLLLCYASEYFQQKVDQLALSEDTHARLIIDGPFTQGECI